MDRLWEENSWSNETMESWSITNTSLKNRKSAISDFESKLFIKN